MTEIPDSTRRLEQVIHSKLRELPLRKAPSGLELRILEEIQRRQALGSSKFNFMSWPLLFKAAFVLVCVAMAVVVTWLTSWGAAQVMGVLRLIPQDWLTAMLVLAAALYGSLFALGAVAYRTLSIQR